MYSLTSPQIMALANRVVGYGGSNLLCSNLEGKVRFANTSACSRLGYSLEDLLGKRISDYCPTHTDDIWAGHCKRTLTNGSDQIYTYHEDCKGNQYPVVVYSIPHLIDETEEQLICSLVEDAHNSKRYKRMLETVETSQHVGSFDFNFNDQSILVSENLMALMGTRDPESLKPASVIDRLRPEDVDRWNSQMIGFINGYHRMDEQFSMRTAGDKDSQIRVVVWSSMDDGKVSGITGYYEVIDEPAEEKMISLEEAQRRHIIKALRYTNGRVTGPSGAGKLLDINGKTLFARMKKLNINREDYRRKN